MGFNAQRIRTWGVELGTSSWHLTDNPLVPLLIVAHHAAEPVSQGAKVGSLAPFVLQPPSINPGCMLTLLAPGAKRNVTLDIIERLVLRLIERSDIFDTALQGERWSSAGVAHKFALHQEH